MSMENPRLVGSGVLSGQSVYTVVTEPRHMPGTRARMDDGREFEYVRSQHATAIGKGKLATYDPIVAAIDKCAVPTSSAVGSNIVYVTVTATLTANELWGATVSVDTNAGAGEIYTIIGHAAHTSGTLALTVGRSITTAITAASSTVTINPGPTAVKISAGVTAQADPVEVAAGVPLVDVGAGDTTNQYFWVQKTGLANVLFGTVVGAVGQALYHGEDAGSFQAMTMDHADTTDRNEKKALATVVALLPVDTTYGPVMLSIA